MNGKGDWRIEWETGGEREGRKKKSRREKARKKK